MSTSHEESLRGLVFKAEGKRWNNNARRWNMVHWELQARLLGCFFFSRGGSMNWRESKWKEQPVRDG